MHDAVKRAFKVGDGLASLTSKKVKAFVAELEQEGVLTAQESKRVVSGLTQLKASVDKNIVAELKKILDSKKANSSKSSKPRKAGKKKRA